MVPQHSLNIRNHFWFPSYELHFYVLIVKAKSVQQSNVYEISEADENVAGPAVISTNNFLAPQHLLNMYLRSVFQCCGYLDAACVFL